MFGAAYWWVKTISHILGASGIAICCSLSVAAPMLGTRTPIDVFDMTKPEIAWASMEIHGHSMSST